ncbi:alpha/beta hydrolase-fold protein [Jidongwangia harbinensis]|uniref:alpha/beta hydrolase-fold protein n=1 Tax=Jidongwangia harbinensis TaxID=2878561 RepID=UPI001CDA4F02|nr:alpha/beta hydrolase-fold protein [Jidongwangia harbinensis]MCA2216916.1 PxKF domain-containing protein [Jidongwangia harbinensis]
MSHSSGLRMTGLAAAAALVVSVIAAAPAAAAADTWHTNDDIYHYFKVPQSQVSSIIGATPTTLELEANIGPSGTWSALALDPSGSDYAGNVGPLEPGLYHYQYTATMADRSKVSFRQPGSPVAVTSKPNWNTFFVPGESVAWMDDVAAGGKVEELSYLSAATGESRTASVWTPPGYDAARAEAYPVLYLLSGEGQTAREWLELGRAKQILDNLVAGRDAKPMVVVMADANTADPRTELLKAIVPAARAGFNISSRSQRQALAGVATGAEQAISILRSDPGTFAYVGSFSGSLDAPISRAQAKAINNGTTLLRTYVGNTLDPSYNDNYDLRTNLKNSGVKFEFDGVNPDDASWDAWRENLRDFAARLFGQNVTGHGPSKGHRALTQPYQPPAAGSITTPHIDPYGVVTFETGTQWADAKDVTVWGNWAPNGQWFRIPMAKQPDGRWRIAVGPLDGYYYYRYVVDGVDKKDPTDTVNKHVNETQLFVPGKTDAMLADVPEGLGGTVSLMTYTGAQGTERYAYVWTPPGYDADREAAYPVLYLYHGGGQNYGSWLETGRAKQILDNHYLNGTLEPMVVVMPDQNGVDFWTDLSQHVRTTAAEKYNVSTDPDEQALAGLSWGAMNTLGSWLNHPGEFAYIGAFSGGLLANPAVDAQAVNDSTKLVRLYSGDVDFTYNFTQSTMQWLTSQGIDYEYAGTWIGPHGFDIWMANLIDFVPRLFTPEYRFGGVRPPLAGDGSDNVKAGTQVAVRFTLTDADGKAVTDAQPRLYLVKKTDGVAGIRVPATPLQERADNIARYNAARNQYVFDWDTTGLAPGTYELQIDPVRGAVHTIALTID